MKTKEKLQNVIRNDCLSNYGFGTDAMKKLSVCPSCRSLQNSENTACLICKTRLTKTTLYDLYRSKHEVCKECETVISKRMHFCPHCGAGIKSIQETNHSQSRIV